MCLQVISGQMANEPFTDFRDFRLLLLQAIHCAYHRINWFRNGKIDAQLHIIHQMQFLFFIAVIMEMIESYSKTMWRRWLPSLVYPYVKMLNERNLIGMFISWCCVFIISCAESGIYTVNSVISAREETLNISAWKLPLGKTTAS